MFNFGEEAEFWVMPDEDANDVDDEQVSMMDDGEVQNFFEFQQELNELLSEEIDNPSIGFEAHNDFEEDQDADADIM